MKNLAISNYSQAQLEGEDWETAVGRSGYTSAEQFGKKAAIWRNRDMEVPAAMFSCNSTSRTRLVKNCGAKDRTVGSEWPGSNVVTVSFPDYKGRRGWLHSDKFSDFPAMWLNQESPIGRIGVAATQQMNEKNKRGLPPRVCSSV